MVMNTDQGDEKLLTNEEVKKILEASLDKPNVIYTGPEEEQSGVFDDSEEEFSETDEDQESEDKFGKLSFEKRATIDHVNMFKRIDEGKADSAIEELTKLERVTTVHAHKIMEIAPRDEVELRPIFAKDRFNLTPEELKKILEIVDKCRL
jgi:DNA-directed RNA polymerase subunit F